MRHSRLTGVLLAGVLATTTSACSNNHGASPIANASGEQLRGEFSESGVLAFRGIPYAAAPIGPLRWRAPASVKPRPGITDAAKFGAACPQDQGNPEWYRDVAKRLGSPDAEIPAIDTISEDCLFLNVWTPTLKPEQLAPVLVWIHGGSNVNGTSFEPNYLGHRLAEKGLVVVTIQYRLGPLGFMAHPLLSAEDPGGISGHYGLLDQIAALKWIRKNVANFGGDPGRVTVAGESAGGGDIAALIDMDEARGLFAQAIIQSGALGPSDRAGLAQAEEVGTRIIEATGASSLEAMRTLSWQELVEARNQAADGHYFAPIADGVYLKRENFAADRVPVLIGSNLDEWRMYLPEDVEARYREALRQYAVPDIRRIESYLAAQYSDPATRADRLITAAEFLCPSLRIAQNAKANGNPAWLYLFTRVRPGADAIRAYHGAEIPYMFDTADAWLPSDETDRRLTEAMTGYWVNFIKTGNPNGADLPDWPAVSTTGPVALEIGDTIRPANPEQYALCEMLGR